MPLYQLAAFMAAANVGRDIAAAFPFATLITPQPGTPWISHLPLLADPHEADCFVGHLARANPHSTALLDAPSVLVFQGEHGYVSPRWYTTPGMVPTWNYRVAHGHGQAELLDADAQLATLHQLAATFEGDSGWTLDAVPPAALAAMSRAIVGFRLRISRWEVKEKLSQNRAATDIRSVIAALNHGDAAAQSLAASMQAHGHTGTKPDANAVRLDRFQGGGA